MGPDGGNYDVFLCHNSRDKPAVKRIGESLRAQGLRPWLDEWELRPGERWQKKLEEQIARVGAAAVFVGTSGLGPWQDMEIDAFLRHFVRRGCAVIPVLLPGCPSPPPALPVFLEAFHYVDFNRAEPDPLGQLLWGITGRRPGVGPSLPAEPTTAAAGGDEELQAPGGNYDRRWHVRREYTERQALANLHRPGKPAVLWGPEGFGKTWLMQHLIAELRQENAAWRTAQVDLQAFSREQRQSDDRFLRDLGAALVEELEGPGDLMARAWQRDSAPNGKLTWLVKELLTASAAPLVLVIDRADAILDTPFRDDFFGLLRSWAEKQKEPWPRLRLLLAVSTTPMRLTGNIHLSVFYGLTVPIQLGHLEPEQVRQLVRLHRLDWSDADLARLMDLVGGHPFLLRLALHEAALHRVGPGALLPGPGQDGLYAQHLRHYRQLLQKDGELHAALRSVGREGTRALDPDAYEELQRMGLVTETDGRYRLCCRLYERLL
jgi:hypothetical protein